MKTQLKLQDMADRYLDALRIEIESKMREAAKEAYEKTLTELLPKLHSSMQVHLQRIAGFENKIEVVISFADISLEKEPPA